MNVRIEVSFSRLDPPEGRATRVDGCAARSAVDEQSFVGWLGLLGALQLLVSERTEPHRP